MTRYWLTPILGYSPLVLGSERIHCTPLADLEAFRLIASRKHPRLLPLFKSGLLLSDDEDVCGSELVELDLSELEDIVFNGDPYHLSHCAEAFLDRLLTRQETWELVSSISEIDWDDQDHDVKWKQQWLRWLEAGFDVIMLREDGY
ncbi:hypothetical protein HQN90_04770 [Paenibacillus alba]|uniref:hypothetical protein n=1 Tax=Paenibacillus alba TaxID=1197127 RepID=UPI0015636E27|nr:hypothetical protein [Paenibacillus alba]NQX65436.1 hypothetical protein [Paenibacillus alba]